MDTKKTIPDTKEPINQSEERTPEINESFKEQLGNQANENSKRKSQGGIPRPLRIAVEHLSYEDASNIVQEQKVTTINGYSALRKKITKLPIDPITHYGEQWKGWKTFFGMPTFYETLEECQEAARALGLTGSLDYKNRRSLDPKLPSAPHEIYPKFPGYEAFLGFADVPYETYEEASAAAIKIGIKTKEDYHRIRRLDPKLPRNPAKHYQNKWAGWTDYLKYSPRPQKRPSLAGKYQTYEEFKQAIRKLGIQNQREFYSRVTEDPLLPGSPQRAYEEWEGWSRALAGRRSYWCNSWQDAREVCLQYKFTSATDYIRGASIDDRLPSNPSVKFSDFPGWIEFLLPSNYDCLDDLKLATKILKLKTEQQYTDFCKKYPQLPSKPEELFEDEWVNWYETCGLPTPYTYDEIQELLELHNCKSFDEYTELWRKLKDPRMPRHPRKFYNEWTSAHDFVKKDPPARFKYASARSVRWVEDMKKYLDTLDVKGSREQTFCKFLKNFIEPNNYGSTVQEFLSSTSINLKKCEAYIESQGDSDTIRRTWYELNSYLNDALVRHFTDEDELTGEVVRIAGAVNPFAAIKVSGRGARPSETVKPALAYQYVEAVRKWIIPDDAKTFSDLTNIHRFDGDYHLVDEQLIDFDDPNCIYRTSGDRFYIWYPANWVALYALVSVPARGRQIMYNDSGELDEFIVEYQDGEPHWVKNNNPLSQKKLQEGFVTHSADGEWGMHFTSNKTGYEGEGYDVPWIPERLMYWLTVLRDWQSKYNPITKPKPWIECAGRTNLTPKKLKRKGANCFLFRAFTEEEPPVFSYLMAPRLAAALYHTQPAGLTLATCDKPGDHSILSRYSSHFTPHSMRVSLITAYIVDFGMPVEVIMKVVGHASIVMSIYYVKINNAKMRQLMAEGEKRALLNQVADVQLMLEQNRLDSLTNSLVANSEEALAALMSGTTGTQLVRDFGICPYAGARCEDGGVKLHAQVFAPVPAGYLGMQNCPRCRHLVSGPVFLGGLVSLWNELSLRLNLYADNHFELDEKLQDLHDKVQKFDHLEMEMEESGATFDDRERLRTEAEIRQIQNNMELVAKKMDMYLCDMQATTKLINDSKLVLNNDVTSSKSDEARSNLILVEHADSEVLIAFEETSLYQQLNEVCTNATIYHSASAELATPRRSQMIDRMTMLNDIRPVMFNLTERQQLILGNQVTEFFFSRLKSWDKVDDIISGTLLLEDLDGGVKISKQEFADILSSEPLTLDFEMSDKESNFEHISDHEN